jgi:hypothetical protein
MTLDDMIAQRDALLAAASLASSTISALITGQFFSASLAKSANFVHRGWALWRAASELSD